MLHVKYCDGCGIKRLTYFDTWTRCRPCGYAATAARIAAEPCVDCGEPKNQGGVNTQRCKDCQNIHKRLLRQVSTYGISKDEYLRILDDQHGVCAVCGEPETAVKSGTTQQLAVDHDHETGAVRGLLCSRCNTMLGLAREDQGILASAILYLADHSVLE